jgi:hypothetical protein
MDRVVGYQEETLLGMIVHKDMMRWSERSHKTLEKVEYVREIHKGQGNEEHGIETIKDKSLARF